MCQPNDYSPERSRDNSDDMVTTLRRDRRERDTKTGHQDVSVISNTRPTIVLPLLPQVRRRSGRATEGSWSSGPR